MAYYRNAQNQLCVANRSGQPLWTTGLVPVFDLRLDALNSQRHINVAFHVSNFCGFYLITVNLRCLYVFSFMYSVLWFTASHTVS